ncbi:MAG TPA: bifunctional diguanylate cyclase/phosphodiesterase [Solirubrobacteraceae bacterium]|nr:bifunctional diguanylate cyclase/phosphodiesterase [Solirubrobacteraceae bacterium]
MTVVLTFVLVGVASYLALEQDLARRQISDYAASQRADGRAFEREGTRAVGTEDGILDIDRLLEGVGERAGTREAFLIDQRHVIRAASNSALVGTIDSDPRIDAALERGVSYAGHEGDPKRDRRDFEFVIPVYLPSGRYAYEVTYDHRAYDAQLSEVRKILALIDLFALLGGGVIFYLVGGRRLMHEHRMVLRRATRDGLTDLPNQRAFQDEFPQAVAAGARYQDSLALVLLDVDDFKLINDRHGHPHGDAILKRVADTLRETRPGDRPYRMGGDEFGLLLSHTDAVGARTLVRRLARSLTEAAVEVTIGVSVLRPGMTADTLRAEADSALYEAKRQGGNRAAYFEDIRERVAVTTSEKKDSVRRLIEEGRLTTVFQPIWNLDAETLIGVEALTRPDPAYGLTGPAEAFDIAEQLGRVHQLDVLCAQSALRSAPEMGPDVLLFINLAPFTLDLDAEGNDWLRLAVEQAGLSPRQVVVEVTERFGGRTASVVKSLQRLREYGFAIAVDDVGTGNSGLEMLSKLNAEFVKLDGSVVSAAATEPGARAVLLAMATFARQTGAFVIAEGIEDDETLQFLRSVDQRDLVTDTIIQGGQGFRLGRPSSELSPQTLTLTRDGSPLHQRHSR